MNQNPYEAPQTTALTDQRQLNPARDYADVRLGAKLCLYAVLMAVGIILTEIFVSQLNKQEPWNGMKWFSTLVGTVALLIQAWGIWLLRKALPGSGVARLLLGSFSSICFSIGVFWSALGITFLTADTSWYLNGFLLCTWGQVLAQLLLYWSLYRLGRYSQTWRLSDWALATFCYSLLLNCYILYGISNVIWSGDLDTIAAYFQEQHNYLGHPWKLAAWLIGYTLAGLTLCAVCKIPNHWETDLHAEPSSPLPADAINAPRMP